MSAISSRAASNTQRHETPWIIYLGTFVVSILIGVGIVTIRNSQTQRQQPVNVRAVLGLPDAPWAPRLTSFGGGKGVDASAVTLADAQSLAGYPVAAPTSSLAPASAIQKVWFWPRPDSGGNVVALEYPQLEIVYAPVPATYQATTTYQNMVQQGADPGSEVDTINGVPAYVAPPETDSQGIAHPGYILYTKNNLQISVEGYYNTDQLTAIADSIAD